MSRATFIASILGKPRPRIDGTQWRAMRLAAALAKARGLTVADLTGYCRKRPTAWARQDLQYALRSELEMTIQRIADFTNRDTSTVQYGINRSKGRLT